MSEPVKHELYGGEVVIWYDDDHHKYTLDTPYGKLIQGVSSALDSIAKPLHFWTVKMAINYIREKLTSGVEVTMGELEGIFEGARKAHLREKNGAADRGTSVHKLCELESLGETFPDPEPGIELDKLNAFRQFIKEANPTFTDTERVVYSRKYGYVGTLDNTLILNGKKYVGDIKTGTAVRDTYWAQTAAYQQALQEETGEVFDGGRVIILLSTDKDTGVSSCTLHFRSNEYFEQDLGAFLAGKYLSAWLDPKQNAQDELITIENLLGL